MVRDNNVDQALRALKKKLQREGVFREMKLRQHFEKPSVKKARERVLTQLVASSKLPAEKAAEFQRHVLGLINETANKDSSSSALQVVFAFRYYGIDIPATFVGGPDD